MTLITSARSVYIAGIVLAVLLFLPQTWFPLLIGKVAIVGLCMALAAVLWGVAVLRGHEPVPGAVWLVGLLPVVYLLSWAFSADQAVGLVGVGLDTDTLFFVTLAFTAAALGAALFRTAQGAWVILRALFATFFVAVLFQCVVILFGLPGPFADHSVNLVGKWNDFGLVLALLSFLLLIELEFGGLSARLRAVAAAAGVVLLVLLSTVNFSLAWGLLLACALAVGTGVWLSQRRVAWMPIVAALAAVAFLFFGAALNAAVVKLLPVTSLEVRPSMQATVDVISAAHGASVKDAALGTGPNTFGWAWLMHKPAAVNQSNFWNLDFNVGFSTLATAFGTTGLLGVLAWLVPILLVLGGAWRVRRMPADDRAAALGLGGAALLLWVAMALYVPSPSLILLAFALAGIAASLLWRGNIPGRPLALGGAALLIVLALASGAVGVRRFVSVALANQASVQLQAGHIDEGRALLAQAQQVETTPDTLRLSIDAGNAKLQQIAAAPSTAQSQDAFKSTLADTIASAQAAIAADGQDYRPYLSLAQVYAFLAANKVAGAYDQAKAAYQAAAARSPMNPSIPLALARLEGAAGTSSQALQEALKQSLTLKPDYTDAILYVVQLDIAQNDLASAIRDTQAAVQTAPGVPSIWFELGLLYYANNDSKNAIAPLEQALKLEPNYANAQYYLGLSYAAQNRVPDAEALFSKLIQSNPDNAEVKSIFSNLQNGKPALFGIATSTTPTSRSTAPVQ